MLNLSFLRKEGLESDVGWRPVPESRRRQHGVAPGGRMVEGRPRTAGLGAPVNQYIIEDCGSGDKVRFLPLIHFKFRSREANHQEQLLF